MRKSSYIVLKSILNTNQRFERLSSFLGKEQLQQLNDCDTSVSFSYKLFLTENILDYIHYSWLIPTLKNFQDDLNLCLASLPEKMQSKLKNHFSAEFSDTPITTNAKEYIHLIFLSSLLGEEDTILPIPYLPYSPINVLAKKPKAIIIKIIDHLALFDLATDLRKTLSTSTIRKIYSFLSESEVKFLKKTNSIKNLAPFSSILEKCDGTKESFRKALHKKGLSKLGLSLSASHPDLIWYICHLLDVGRGSSLMKMCEKKVNTVISDTIQSHILKILELLQV